MFHGAQQVHPCDGDDPSQVTAPANKVVTFSYCQPQSKTQTGEIVPVHGWQLTWNGNVMDVVLGATPGPNVAAPFGQPSASGEQEWRTTLFFGEGTHRLEWQAFNIVNGQRQLSSPPLVVTVVAAGDTPPPPLALSCPANMTTTSPNGSPVAVSYQASTSGGVEPVTVSGVPASGGAFPVGTTMVTVTAKSSDGQSAACNFTVTVTHTPTDVCITTPLRVTGIKWPAGQTGNRSGSWNSGSFVLTKIEWLWTPQRVAFTDNRGCSVTVQR